MSAGKVFGANIHLSAVVGLVLTHQNLMNIWSVATTEAVPTVVTLFSISVPFGIGAAIAGGVYGITVVGRDHHMYNALFNIG